jgi:hypothetical protein
LPIGSNADHVTIVVFVAFRVTVSVLPEEVAANIAFDPLCGSGGFMLSLATTSAPWVWHDGTPVAVPFATLSGVQTRSWLTR